MHMRMAMRFGCILALTAAGAPAHAQIDGKRGGLPAPIAKTRSSASVPADLPGSRVDACRLLGGVTIDTPIGHRAYANVAPSDVMSSASGQSCFDAAPPTSLAPPGVAPPQGGALPFGAD